LVRHLARVLPADFVFTGALKPGANRVVALAAFGETGETPPMEFDLAETPFVALPTKAVSPFVYHEAAAELFPNDPILRRIPGNGYVGAPLVDSSGKPVGVMSAIVRRRLEDARLAKELIRIFSVRAAAELERTKQLEALQYQNADLRHSIEDLTALKLSLERDDACLRDEFQSRQSLAIGGSAKFQALMSQVRRVANTSADVLVHGEIGTGKELVARAIHNNSPRRRRPLVRIDCTAVPPDSLEIELFGGVRNLPAPGVPRIGRLAYAEGGTLLIREVAELPLETQAKLLRVIHQKEFRPVGSNRAVQIDVRLLVTTNRNLEEAIKQGRFRSDLYARLAGDAVKVPPLRQRRQDIPLLAEHFLSRYLRRMGRAEARLSDPMMRQMLGYDWPGNIVELQGVLFRAALSPDAVLDLPLNLPVEAAASLEAATLEDANRRHVERTLASCNRVIEGPRGAAAVLNVPPSTLRSLMKRLGIQRAGKSLVD
jgi:formate hydrogenlyase transcriptional activator